MTSMLARATVRRVTAHVQPSTIVCKTQQTQHLLRPSLSTISAPYTPSRVHVCAFSNSTIRKDESEPDTVDTLESIVKPKRVRKPKAESTAGDASEGTADAKPARKRAKPLTEKQKAAKVLAKQKQAAKKEKLAAKKAEAKSKQAAAKVKEATRKAALKTKEAAAKAKSKKKAPTAEEKQKQKIKELKEAALLDEPRIYGANVYSQYVLENSKGEKITDFSARSKDLAEGFRNISSSERERLEQEAKETKGKSLEVHKAWVQSHTPEQISNANLARHQLHRLAKVTSTNGKKRGITSLPLRVIADTRQPKKAASGWVLFVKERHASGEFAQVAVIEATKTIASEWKSLSADEAQKYKDEAQTKKEEYEKKVAEMSKTAS